MIVLLDMQIDMLRRQGGANGKGLCRGRRKRMAHDRKIGPPMAQVWRILGNVSRPTVASGVFLVVGKEGCCNLGCPDWWLLTQRRDVSG